MSMRVKWEFHAKSWTSALHLKMHWRDTILWTTLKSIINPKQDNTSTVFICCCLTNLLLDRSAMPISIPMISEVLNSYQISILSQFMEETSLIWNKTMIISWTGCWRSQMIRNAPLNWSWVLFTMESKQFIELLILNYCSDVLSSYFIISIIIICQ